MNATTPFHWNYAVAFAFGSMGGLSGILFEEVRKRELFRHPEEFSVQVATSFYAGVLKVIQSIAMVSMMQAACLSLGDERVGLANYIPQPASNLEFGPRQSPGVGRSQIGPYLLILTDLRSSNRGSFRVGPNPSLKPAGV